MIDQNVMWEDVHGLLPLQVMAKYIHNPLSDNVSNELCIKVG